jgi:hypothetical protein
LASSPTTTHLNDKLGSGYNHLWSFKWGDNPCPPMEKTIMKNDEWFFGDICKEQQIFLVK